MCQKTLSRARFSFIFVNYNSGFIDITINSETNKDGAGATGRTTQIRRQQRF
jgi:hypothetical protein